MPVEGVGGEAGALFQHHADLVVPVGVVVGEGDEGEFVGSVAVQRGADVGLGAGNAVGFAEEAGVAGG